MRSHGPSAPVPAARTACRCPPRRGSAGRRARGGGRRGPSAVPCTSTNAAAVVHDHVHVGLGLGVLLIVEVEHRHAADRCRPRPPPPGRAAGLRRSARRAHQLLAGVGERHEAAGDGGRARAAVGLQHVAVERDGALAQAPSGPTTARSERPISRWISWVRPLCLPRAASRAMRVCVARGSMPYSAVIQPWPLPRRKRWHAVLDARRAQHLRVAELDQHRAFGVLGVAAREAHRPQLHRARAPRVWPWD